MRRPISSLLLAETKQEGSVLLPACFFESYYTLVQMPSCIGSPEIMIVFSRVLRSSIIKSGAVTPIFGVTINSPKKRICFNGIVKIVI